MDAASKINQANDTQPVVLPLYNLSCSGDVRTIERLIAADPGVVEV